MSQFLQNGPLGKKHSKNLKILKCPGNPDATVSLSITILEQVEEKPSQPYTDESSYKSENSSSIFSRYTTISSTYATIALIIGAQWVIKASMVGASTHTSGRGILPRSAK
jgi:hypothetical protein